MGGKDVMVNVQAARRYGRSFSIPDEGGARGWYAREYPVRAETPYVNHFVVRHSQVLEKRPSTRLSRARSIANGGCYARLERR